MGHHRRLSESGRPLEADERAANVSLQCRWLLAFVCPALPHPVLIAQLVTELPHHRRLRLQLQYLLHFRVTGESLDERYDDRQPEERGFWFLICSRTAP